MSNTKPVVYLTGISKTLAAASGSFAHYLSPGDKVDAAIVDYFTDTLPPLRSLNAVQLGEPMDHEGADGAARYLTLQLDVDGQWYYTGCQVALQAVVLAMPRTPAEQALHEADVAMAEASAECDRANAAHFRATERLRAAEEAVTREQAALRPVFPVKS